VPLSVQTLKSTLLTDNEKKEIHSKEAVFKKLFILPEDTFCMTGMILPISARFEAKQHEFVCVNV